jgi:hypothetical protein
MEGSQAAGLTISSTKQSCGRGAHQEGCRAALDDGFAAFEHQTRVAFRQTSGGGCRCRFPHPHLGRLHG